MTLGRGGQDLAPKVQDGVGLAHRLGEVPARLVQGDEEEVAEGVAGKLPPVEAVGEEAGKGRVVGGGGQAVPRVPPRREAVGEPEPPRGARVVRGVHLKSAVEQQPRDLHMAPARGQMQGRGTGAISGAQIRAASSDARRSSS